jgi:hypothetical protein
MKRESVRKKRREKLIKKEMTDDRQRVLSVREK